MMCPVISSWIANTFSRGRSNANTDLNISASRRRLTTATLLTCLALDLAGAGSAARAEGMTRDGHYENTLHNPSATVLLAEAKGRVTIYDGLQNEEVEQALDDQFGRIDNMMFIRTKMTQPNGDAQVDDDC